jgi:hypothetical protein
LCYDALIQTASRGAKFAATVRRFMELPVFQDNLRSSGGWAAALDAARARWQAATGTDDRLLEHARERQTEHAVRRAEQQGGAVGRDNFAAAASQVSAWAVAAQSTLTAPRLIEINRALVGAEADARLWRTGEAAPLDEAHDPPPAAMLPRLVDNALDWFSTAGFAEMNPVEQAALVHLRLLDLQAFAAANEATALFAASFYAERAGLPPLVIESDEAAVRRYSSALAAAFRMLTQPLVEFFADCLIETVNRAVAEEG